VLYASRVLQDIQARLLRTGGAPLSSSIVALDPGDDSAALRLFLGTQAAMSCTST
jgi:hypothetical protein